MNKSFQAPSSDELAPRAEDVDPWSEFLSEAEEPAAAAASAPPVDLHTTAPSAPAAELPLHPDRSTAAAAVDLRIPDLPDARVAPLHVEPLTEDLRGVPPVEQVESAVDAIVPARLDQSAPAIPVAPSAPAAPPALQDADASLSDVQLDVPAALERRPAARVTVTADTDRVVSIAQVIALQVPVYWQEAVATVEELCATLIAQQLTVIPEMAGVVITAGGSVAVRSTKRGDRDVRNLGRMLHALLASASTPLPLRLFVTSSISSDRFHSIELFADALSHYGMPRRTELIQALYKRAGEARAPVIAVPSRTRVSAAAAARRTKIRAAVLAALAGVVCASAATFLLWRSSSGGAPRGGSAVAAAVDRVSEVLEATVPAPAAVEAPTPRDDWKLGSIIVPPQPPARDPQQPPAVTRTPRPETVRTAPLPAAAPVAAVTPSAEPPPVTRDRVPAPVATRTPVVPITTAPRPPVFDPTIYSRDDADVQPPVMIVSQLPSLPQTPGEADSRVTNVVEFIIDERGEVLKVSFLNRPSRLPDMSTLSALKLLKFRPARRNGLPVRYQLHVKLDGTSG